MPSDFFLENLCRKTRTYLLFGDISEEATANLIKAFIALTIDSKKKPIQLLINSDGGSLYEAFAIYDTIRSCPAPVIGTVIGTCMSSALLVHAACSKRVASQNATFLLHLGSQAVDESTPQEAMSDVKQGARIGQRYDEILATRTGNTIRQIKKWSQQARYFNATDAAANGFLDSLIKSTR